ncbi:hypothetical protein RB195_004246 [Necator americanus]|uniref:Uncharacterized protein n=2 Tax=Necator americanus TaxID=51031 RepID=W2T2Y7_NECAM|nr:hypothetical protein NECAME_12028 [Necator americanus]ETN75929.1 hypothetical protein NECAME_12028 [Necator americanus]
MSPGLPMRGMIHKTGRRAIAVAFSAAIASTIAFNMFYVMPRHEKYEEFFKNYDPYTRMKEICASGTGYMHTCPKDLAKSYEEKGKKIAPL